MDMQNDFSSAFRALTGDSGKDGFEPLRWQQRLFSRFCSNDIPGICDLPTGMGKTSVIHLWMLALRYQMAEKKPRLPTRLVYVVDRRTVVDQATAVAERIKKNLTFLGLEESWLSVSTLRGQFADNRDWATNPSRPAIIIGTVDMIGSRLLFSGYGSSYKWRPLDAGLLGQDSFLVLDEAHLSTPFARLIHALSDEGTFQRNQGLPMRVMCMSATSAGGHTNAFRLEDTDLKGNGETNPVVRRYESKKRLTIEPPVDKQAIEEKVVKKAIELAEDSSRVVVFVKSPDDARRIATAIRKSTGVPDSVEVLTGTMRGLERDKLLEKPVLKRFLDGEERPEHRCDMKRATLVSTSAGEVGFDLNADHLVCDAAPLDSMIQRLGRVNRRGYGDAEVRVFVAGPDGTRSARDERSGKKPRNGSKSATVAAIKCLEGLAKNESDGTYNASPKALDELKKTLTGEQLIEASTPTPTVVEVTDILLDAWSMTSIAEAMPGRPQVAHWLRGINDDLPQTTIAWRAELALLTGGADDLKALEAVFEKHRIRPHETLTTRTDYVVDFLEKAVKAHSALAETQVVLIARELTSTSIGALIKDNSPLRANPTLVLPPAFGGLDDAGMLDDKSVAFELQLQPRDTARLLDVADAPDYERHIDDLPRLRLLLEHTDDGWAVRPMPGAPLPESLQGLPRDRTALVDTLKGRLRMNVRLRQPLKTDEEGEVTLYLLALGPRHSKKPASEQSLSEHVKAVEACAAKISEATSLAEPFESALRLAAQYHDEGKKTTTWQHSIRHTDLTQPLGKSGGAMNVKRLNGYRHEFGTLLRITDATQPVADSAVDPDAVELMLHLIATHHGNGRPHFKRPDDIDYYDRKRCPQVAIEVVRRFARLQRRYGYWRLAWLENLLRCADAMASAENDEEET